MSCLVTNPEDTFGRDKAHIIPIAAAPEISH